MTTAIWFYSNHLATAMPVHGVALDTPCVSLHAAHDSYAPTLDEIDNALNVQNALGFKTTAMMCRNARGIRAQTTWLIANKKGDLAV
jgi:hypothetical protein